MFNNLRKREQGLPPTTGAEQAGPKAPDSARAGSGRTPEGLIPLGEIGKSYKPYQASEATQDWRLRKGDKVFAMSGISESLPVIPLGEPKPVVKEGVGRVDQTQSWQVMQQIASVRTAISSQPFLAADPKRLAAALGAHQAADRVFRAGSEHAVGSDPRSVAIYKALGETHRTASTLLDRIDRIPGEVSKARSQHGDAAAERREAFLLESVARETRERMGLPMEVDIAPSISLVGKASGSQGVNKDLLVAYLHGAQTSCMEPGNERFTSAADVANTLSSGRLLRDGSIPGGINAGRSDAFHPGLVAATQKVIERIEAGKAVDADYARRAVTANQAELAVVASRFVNPGHPNPEAVVNGMMVAAYRAVGNPHENYEVRRIQQAMETGEVPSAGPVTKLQVAKETKDDLVQYGDAAVAFLSASNGAELREAKASLLASFENIRDDIKEALIGGHAGPDEIMAAYQNQMNAMEEHRVSRALQAVQQEQGFSKIGAPGSNTIIVRQHGTEVVVAQPSDDLKRVRCYSLDGEGNPVRVHLGDLDSAPLKREAKQMLSLLATQENLNPFRIMALASRHGIIPVDGPVKMQLDRKPDPDWSAPLVHKPTPMRREPDAPGHQVIV